MHIPTPRLSGSDSQTAVWHQSCIHGSGRPPQLYWKQSISGAIALAAVVYVVLVMLLRIITREDLEMLPKGEKLAKFLHER